MQIFFIILETIGVISFSVSGAVAAINKEIDLFGVIFLSIITSFGGGVLRDVLIGNSPAFFTGHIYILCSALTSVTVFIIAAIFKERYIKHEVFADKINNYFDAVGLGIFSVMGAKICIASGYPSALVAISLGMITGVGGGMIRDLCLHEIPFILKKRVYAVASIMGASVYYITFCTLGISEYAAMILGIGIVVIIRVLATIFKLNIPKAIVFDRYTDIH